MSNAANTAIDIMPVIARVTAIQPAPRSPGFERYFKTSISSLPLRLAAADPQKIDFQISGKCNLGLT
jgi:hypothetical protein